ncbi:MAG: hypothetical protein IBX57_11965 [Gammaproteobacteria bacterium]|nr:hypothetical protein [Gammaproteobacteria bacterium]
MISTETMSYIANVATIISSFTIVVALFVYIKNKIQERKKFDFSVPNKRKKYFLILSKNPSLIDKVAVNKRYKKGSKLNAILSSRYNFSANGDIERLLQDGFRFILSDGAIRAFRNLDSAIFDNFDAVLSRFCSLVVDGEDFYASDSEKIDAWIELEKIKQFVVKFPIPQDLFDKEVFSEIRFGGKNISSLGSAVIHNYFLPYLILYVAKNYDSFSKDDPYTVLSVLWKVGPS